MSYAPLRTPLLACRSSAASRDLYPKLSMRLGPAWGVVRAIRLQARATRWPDELEGNVLTVTDPEFGQPMTGSLSPLRQEAILSRMALVCRAVGIPVTLEFEPGLGFELRPSGAREPFDRRAELRREAERALLWSAEAAKRRAERRERSRPALEALERGC